MALMLIDKTATFRSIHNKARMQDPAILRLRSKVRLEAPGERGAGSGSERLPLLEVTLNDGRRLVQDTGPVLGTIQNRMTEQQLQAKCRDLMMPVLGAAQTGRLIDSVFTIERTKDLHGLRPLLQRTYKTGPPRLSDYPMSR
jgi:hypothetical protein